MRERPIIFSAPMVRAILEGRKTVTRRVVKPQPARSGNGVLMWGASHPGMRFGVEGMDIPPGVLARCPYGAPGDHLWVREAFSGPWHQEGFAPALWHSMDEIWYWADGNPTAGDWTRPRPSIHMPRWASRITLEIESVRVERLQDISEADAEAEGVRNSLHLQGGRFARDNFAHLWWTINGDGSWEANPWVWVVSFRRITP